MRVLFLTFVMISIIISCEQPPVEIKLSNKDFKVVDSLVKVQKKQMRKELDSLCNNYMKAYYDNAVDSITVVRRANILEILNE